MLLATASEVQRSKESRQNNLRGLSHISPTSLQPLHCSVLSAVWRLSSISYKDKRNDEKQAISGLYCIALEALASIILYMKEKADSFRCTLELSLSYTPSLLLQKKIKRFKSHRNWVRLKLKERRRESTGLSSCQKATEDEAGFGLQAQCFRNQEMILFVQRIL